MVAKITGAVLEREALGPRRNRRREAGCAKLRHTVGAIVGGVLRAWAREQPRAVYRSLATASFTGEPVTHQQFTAATEGLVALGLLATKAGIRFSRDLGFDRPIWAGRTTRYRPTAALLKLAHDHGVFPATVATDFTRRFSVVPPPVRELLVMHPLRQDRQRGQRQAKPCLPIAPTDITAQALKGEVSGFNEWAAAHVVTGCAPPRWYRVFTADWRLGGRWTAGGTESYQTLAKEERRQITINGEPVAEVDVRASQLCILYGLSGLPVPCHDPYEADGIARDVVKQWIVVSLGRGSPARRWPVGASSELTARWPAALVADAVLARHPILANPAAVVPFDLARLASAEQVLTHCLMAIEARAITRAMMSLRDQGVLALPLHDGLIVPASAAEAAQTAIREGYRMEAGVEVVAR